MINKMYYFYIIILVFVSLLILLSCENSDNKLDKIGKWAGSSVEDMMEDLKSDNEKFLSEFLDIFYMFGLESQYITYDQMSDLADSIVSISKTFNLEPVMINPIDENGNPLKDDEGNLIKEETHPAVQIALHLSKSKWDPVIVENAMKSLKDIDDNKDSINFEIYYDIIDITEILSQSKNSPEKVVQSTFDVFDLTEKYDLNLNKNDLKKIMSIISGYHNPPAEIISGINDVLGLYKQFSELYNEFGLKPSLDFWNLLRDFSSTPESFLDSKLKLIKDSIVKFVREECIKNDKIWNDNTKECRMN